MSISDLISILSIILAILAFLDENDRAFIRNKFGTADFILITVIFCYINFLLFFDWWYKQVSFINIFVIDDFPKASTWAYIISILTLIWINYKIFFAKFPKTNYISLIRYYSALLTKKESNRLLRYILTYNRRDLKSYLNQNTNHFNSFLFNQIVLNNGFLQETSAYNHDLEKLIRQYGKENDSGRFYNRYFCTQLNTSDSILSNLMEDNTFDFEEAISLDLVDNEKFLDCCIKNLHANKSPIQFLLNLIKSFYTAKQITPTNELIDLNKLLLTKIFNSNDKKLLNSYCVLLIESKGLSNNQLYFFNSLILNTIHIDASNQFINDIAGLILQIGVALYDRANLKREIIKSLTIEIQGEQYRTLRRIIYNSFNTIDIKTISPQFKPDIIDVISNY
jgi:hypothetical protein